MVRKLLSEIKSMDVDSLAYVKVEGDENERSSIDSWVRQGCIMSPWLLNVYMDAVMKVCGSNGRKLAIGQGLQVPLCL